MSNNRYFWARYARAYDKVIGNYSAHKALVDLHFEALKKCRTVLDSGCGPGHLVKKLIEQPRRVYAVDMNPKALKILNERCGYNPDVIIECIDANNLPYKEQFFDGISSMLVLWAVKDPEKYLVEHFRVLKPGGILVLSGPGAETRDSVDLQLKTLRQDLENQGLFPEIQRSWDDFLKYTDQNISNTAENWYTRDEISELLEKTGFIIISINSNPVYCNQGHVIIAKKAATG